MEQRLLDMRTYRLMCVHFTEPPEPGKLFPFLNIPDSPQDPDPDDESNFRLVTAALTPYR